MTGASPACRTDDSAALHCSNRASTASLSTDSASTLTATYAGGPAGCAGRAR